MPVTIAAPRLLAGGAQSANAVYATLTSVIAGHAQATETYTFYEVVDAWLGPWGQRGYPIAYGKKYNILFSQNPRLQGNAQARHWVWRTGILLQEALRDYLVDRVRAGTIQTLTEPELRAAAFASHPLAYDRGGLAMVMLVAPELIPVIATIPGAEFSPTSENFGPTVRQAFVTANLVGPEMAGNSLGAMALPAHTGIFSRAAQLDRRAMLDEINLGRELGSLRQSISRGEVDYLPALDALIRSLNARQFPDQQFARLAREVILAAEQRRLQLQEYYRNALSDSPEIEARVRARFPNLLRPR